MAKQNINDFISVVQDWGDYIKVTIMHCSRAGIVELFVYNVTDVAEIAGLYVVPERRGQGIAKMLIAMAEEKARELGAKRAKLFSEPHLTALYKELGYSAKDVGLAIDCVVDDFADVGKIAWHKVADGDLPKVDKYQECIKVFVRRGNDAFVAFFSPMAGFCLSSSFYTEYLLYGIEYWMEIPELPKED